MNKQELLNDLESKDFVEKLLGEPAKQPGNYGLGVSWYTQEIFEIVGVSGNTRTIHFFVLDEGEASEKAIYKDRFPMPQGKDYAVITEYVDDANKKLMKRYLLEYVDGTFVKTEITKEIK